MPTRRSTWLEKAHNLEEEKDEICQEEEVGVYYCNLSYSVNPVVNYYTAGRHE